MSNFKRQMRNYRVGLIKKLRAFSIEDIIISEHAMVRIKQRQLDINEIKENIINPKRLKYAIKQFPLKKGEAKYDCYFDYSKNLCHRYVIVIRKNIIVVTAIKINRRWQNIVYSIKKK